MVQVLAVGTNRAACAATAATCCTARRYCCILSAALRAATVYCLLYVCEYGLLLLAIYIPGYIYSRMTCCRLLLALALKVIPNEI